MTRLELVALKASRIQGRLERIRLGIAIGAAQFPSRPDLVEQVAFNMLLAMQECVDLGSHIVTDEGWGAPASLGDTFTFLHDHGIIAPETAAAMKAELDCATSSPTATATWIPASYSPRPAPGSDRSNASWPKPATGRPRAPAAGRRPSRQSRVARKA